MSLSVASGVSIVSGSYPSTASVIAARSPRTRYSKTLGTALSGLLLRSPRAWARRLARFMVPPPAASRRHDWREIQRSRVYRGTRPDRLHDRDAAPARSDV